MDTDSIQFTALGINMSLRYLGCCRAELGFKGKVPWPVGYLEKVDNILSTAVDLNLGLKRVFLGQLGIWENRQCLIYCCRAELGFKRWVPWPIWYLGKADSVWFIAVELNFFGFKGRVPWPVWYLGKADSVWFTVRLPQLFLPSGSHLKLAGWRKNKNKCNKSTILAGIQ